MSLDDSSSGTRFLRMWTVRSLNRVAKIDQLLLDQTTSMFQNWLICKIIALFVEFCF